MTAGADASPGNETAAERKLLAALCQGTITQPTRERLLLRFETHRFAAPQHEVIFAALRMLPAGNTDRAAMERTLTRLGFPDLELGPFFEEAAPAEGELLTLLDGLGPGA